MTSTTGLITKQHGGTEKLLIWEKTPYRHYQHQSFPQGGLNLTVLSYILVDPHYTTRDT